MNLRSANTFCILKKTLLKKKQKEMVYVQLQTGREQCGVIGGNLHSIAMVRCGVRCSCSE